MKPTQSLSVKQLVAESLSRLRAGADERVAAQSRGYFKAYEQVSFYGWKTPALRKLESELYQRVRGVWTVTEAVAFCDALVRRKELEAKTLGILLLARYKKSYSRDLLKQFESWLAANHCDNWAATDALGTFVIAFLLQRQPELAPQVQGWTAAKNLWLRRAAAVSLVPLARKGILLDEAYTIAELLFPYPEDLIHKATGWLLREAGKADQPRLQAFLLTHGARIPRTALRYAIERFPQAERKQLLAQTR
jgi:3-methyladenine DNA glycosylase AlkD